MKELFIPYAEALEMKQLGFNEPCFGFFGDDGKLYFDNIVSNFEDGLNPEYCSVPIYSQAFKWFRDMGFGIMDKLFYSSKDLPNITYAKDIIRWSNGKVYKMERKNTYEQAELECLKKLILIVKEQKLNENI